MKSISFSEPHMFDKIINGEKTITIRGLYIPDFSPGDVVQLKERLGVWREKKFGRVVEAEINLVKPIKIKDINDLVAAREGFQNAEESREWLEKKYHVKSEHRWFFAIGWRKIKKPYKFITEFVKEYQEPASEDDSNGGKHE